MEYEVKVTASWWVTVNAKNDEEAEQKAWDTFLDNGSYDGVESIDVYPSGIEDEEEDDE